MASIPVALRPPWVKISQRLGPAGAADPLGVDRHHDALLAEFFGAFLDELPARDCGAVDGHLVGAGAQQRADIVDGAHAATDRQRHEAGLCRSSDDVEHGAAVFMGRGDIEEAELVGARRVIGDRRLDGIAGVAQVDEVDALDDAAVLDVETGDHANLEHVCFFQAAARALLISASAAAGSSLPS